MLSSPRQLTPMAAPPPPLFERHAGWLMSAALHVGLFALLFANKVPPLISAALREPIRVVLADLPPAQPTPEVIVAAANSNLAAAPAGAVQAALDPIAKVPAPKPVETVAVKAPEIITPAKPKAPPAPAKPAVAAHTKPLSPSDLPSPELLPATDVVAGASNLPSVPAGAANGVPGGTAADALYSQAVREGVAGSGEVAEKLRLHNVQTKAEQLLYNSRGVEEGAIRELDVSGIPEEQARKVLERYGIRILLGLNGIRSAPQSGFLSSAKTRGGRYTNTDAYGPVEIFQYGPSAIQRMVQLESAALKERGYTEKTVRIVRVVFGVVPTPAGYDLGIKRLEATEIPKTSAAP